MACLLPSLYFCFLIKYLYHSVQICSIDLLFFPPFSSSWETELLFFGDMWRVLSFSTRNQCCIYYVNISNFNLVSTWRNQGCFRRFANSPILKTSLLCKVLSCHIFMQTRLLNAHCVGNLSYSQIKTIYWVL